MKRSSLLIVSIVFLATISRGQSAFYDAKKIAGFHPTVLNGKVLIPNNDSIYKLLRNYTSQKDSTKNLIGEAIRNNPFISVPIPAGGAGIPKGILSSLGSLDVTNIADGIARFLIKRGTEELNVAFFNRFRDFLNKYAECKILFPKTIEVFKNVEPYRYAEFIQNLREKFREDLSNLIISLNELIELPKYQKLLQDLPEIRLAIRSTKIVQELSQSEGGILPDSIITELAGLHEWGEINVNLGNSWRLLDVISQSVRYVPNNSLLIDTAQRWIKLSDMNALVKDTTTLKIFLGLVYQKMGGIYFKIKQDSISVQEFMSNNRNNILSVASLIENFLTLADDVDRTIKDFKEKQKTNLLSNEDYYTYINKAVNITEYGFKAANTIYKFKVGDTSKVDLLDNRYIVLAKSGNDLYRNIYTKNYNGVVLTVYDILNQVSIHKNELAEEKAESTNLDAASRANLMTSINSTKTIDPKVLEGILKYGNFMASVVRAESGEEVQKALDAAALPAGSYSVKQKSYFNLSLNGYIGYIWDFNFAHGIYAPVGLSGSFGSRRKHGLCYTFFTTLIDVGSVASYRLANGNSDNLKQEVRLESIFSPSAQLFFQVGGFPLAVGGGWRRTPKLFYSNNNGFVVQSPRNVFNLSILVDIPFFTLINHPFEKK